MLASANPRTRSMAERVTASALASPRRALSALMDTSLNPLRDANTFGSKIGGGSVDAVALPGVGLLFLMKPSMTCRIPLMQMVSILSFSVASVLRPTQRFKADMTIASALGLRAFERFSTKPFLRPTTAVSSRGSMTGLEGAVTGGVADGRFAGEAEWAAGATPGEGLTPAAAI